MNVDQNKPFVSLCANCQSEFPEVLKAVQANHKRINFSHGICKRHAAGMLKQMGKSPQEIEAYTSKMDGKIPDLKERPDLVKLYSQGIFTKEDLAKAQQSQQQLQERWKKLANIRS